MKAVFKNVHDKEALIQVFLKNSGRLVGSKPLFKRRELLFLRFFKPSIGMLAHGDQIDTNVPMTRAASFRIFKLVIDF